MGKPDDAKKSSILISQRDVTGLARSVRKLVRPILSLIGLIFTWVQLKDVRFSPIIHSVDADVARQVALIIYYWCWVFGCEFDLRIQENSYVLDRTRVYIAKMGIFLIIVLGATTVVMFWRSKEDQEFSLALLAFIVVNFIGFVYIKKFMRPVIETSRQLFSSTGDHHDLIQLEIVAHYMSGRWQYVRFSYAAACIIVIISVCFVGPAREMLSNVISRIPGIDMTPSEVSKIVVGLMFLFYVVTVELWIWIMRARSQLAIHVVADIAERYSFVRLPAAPPVRPGPRRKRK